MVPLQDRHALSMTGVSDCLWEVMYLLCNIWFAHVLCEARTSLLSATTSFSSVSDLSTFGKVDSCVCGNDMVGHGPDVW